MKTACPDPREPLAERMRAARERLSGALRAMTSVFGSGEASLPFGLSKRRMEINEMISRGYPSEASTMFQRVVAEIIEAGLAEESRIDFVVVVRDGKPRCVAVHYLNGGETYET